MTGSRINVLTAHAQIIVAKVAENGVARPKLPRLYRKTDALNSNNDLRFYLDVVDSKLCMRTGAPVSLNTIRIPSSS